MTSPSLGDGDAQRTQPVAVESGSGDRAVREAERSRAVPGLAQQRAVAMEVAHLGVEPRVVLPRRRNEQRHRLGEVFALTADEQLERVVENRRVGPVRVERRREARLDLPTPARAPPSTRRCPSIVLISPLWQRSRNGCARSQLGSVFVEKRWWKIANGTASSGSSRSG